MFALSIVISHKTRYKILGYKNGEAHLKSQAIHPMEPTLTLWFAVWVGTGETGVGGCKNRGRNRQQWGSVKKTGRNCQKPGRLSVAKADGRCNAAWNADKHWNCKKCIFSLLALLGQNPKLFLKSVFRAPLSFGSWFHLEAFANIVFDLEVRTVTVWYQTS